MTKKLNNGIYIIRNIINNKVYVKSCSNLSNRKRGHFNALKRDSHENKHLQSAFNSYGKENFSWQIIYYTDNNIDYLLYLEELYIALEIKKLIFEGLKNTEIANILGLKRDMIQDIRKGRSWRHVIYEPNQ